MITYILIVFHDHDGYALDDIKTKAVFTDRCRSKKIRTINIKVGTILERLSNITERLNKKIYRLQVRKLKHNCFFEIFIFTASKILIIAKCQCIQKKTVILTEFTFAVSYITKENAVKMIVSLCITGGPYIIALLVFLIIVLRYLYYEYVFYYHKIALEILYQNMYDWVYNLFGTLRERMKSKNLQTTVKNKYGKGDGPMKIYRNLGGAVSLRTIKLWVQMLNKTRSINLSHLPGRPTKADISKVKYRLAHNETMSTRRLAAEVNISRNSAHRMLREDLGCFPYKKIKQPKLTDLQKRIVGRRTHLIYVH